MNKQRKTTKETDYRLLQDELTERYGPAIAQELVDQIKKTEQTREMPDYMNFHAVSEVLDDLRREARHALQALKVQKQATQAGDVIDFDEALAKTEFERLFHLYCQAQQGFYRMYRSAMAAYIEETPSRKQYHKHRHLQPEMAKAA